MAKEYYLLENGVDKYQLEDGSGNLLLEVFMSDAGFERVTLVPFDSRTSLVEFESRTSLVPFESRTSLVGKE